MVAPGALDSCASFRDGSLSSLFATWPESKIHVLAAPMSRVPSYHLPWAASGPCSSWRLSSTSRLSSGPFSASSAYMLRRDQDGRRRMDSTELRQVLGHSSTTMIEQHYGNLLDSDIAQSVQGALADG